MESSGNLLEAFLYSLWLGLWMVVWLVGIVIAILLMVRKKIPRARVLLTSAHAFFLTGLLIIFVALTKSSLISPVVIALFPLLFLTATPLYFVALWADKTDKILNPLSRWLCWLCAFVSIMVIGFYVWVSHGLLWLRLG